MSKQTNIRLQEQTRERLDNIAQTTGRSVSFYIHEAINEHLDNLEDIYLAETALNNLKKGHDEILNSEQFWHEMEN